MPYIVFLINNAILFIRPAEIFEGIEGWPIYEFCMIIGLVLAWPGMLRNLSPHAILTSPITACVLAYLGCVVLTTGIGLAGVSGYEALQDLGKIAVFYLMLVSIVNTVSRLKSYLAFLTCCIALTAILPLAQEAELIQLKSLSLLEQKDKEEDGTRAVVYRLKGTGNFDDPNDFAMLMIVGVALGLGMRELYAGTWLAVAAATSIIPMVIAFLRTASRGGMLAFIAMLVSWLGMKYGWRRAVYLCLIIGPCLFWIVGGRAANIGEATEEGTGQSRLKLWSASLQALRTHPVLGVGYRQTADYNEERQVAHNSFLSAFVESGFFGGTLFLGAFLLALFGVARAPVQVATESAQVLTRARPAILAAVGAAATSMLSLSRQYVVVPYLVLGLAADWYRLGESALVWPAFQINARLCLRLGGAAILFLVALYLFVRLFVNYG